MINRRTLPLSALRAFESAGHHLHMGRAGEALGVTHGAISHQVRALEQQLKVKLFIRSNNRLKLTSAGERLLTAVREGTRQSLFQFSRLQEHSPFQENIRRGRGLHRHNRYYEDVGC